MARTKAPIPIIYPLTDPTVRKVVQRDIRRYKADGYDVRVEQVNGRFVLYVTPAKKR